MTEHYVTLFDSGFLPYALALHGTLVRHGGDFRLWAVCLDQAAVAALGRLALSGVGIIPLPEVEASNPRLIAVKPGRSRAEYCWTMTPFVFDAAFAHAPEAERLTYIDVDVALFGDPAVLFQEMTDAGKSVLITEHAFHPRYQHLADRSGRFCVQFLTMTRAAGATAVRRWWQERCLEWCYDRYEPERFGDQKYLDRWPTLFAEDVHVLRRCELTQAPWNRERFANVTPVIFHFQGLRRIGGCEVLLFYGFKVPAVSRQPYVAYIEYFAAACATLRTIGCEPPHRPYHWAKLLKARWWHQPRGFAGFSQLPPVVAIDALTTTRQQRSTIIR